jgi:Cupin domain
VGIPGFEPTVLFYVLEGEMTVSVGDRSFKATPGTMVCPPRDVAHSFAIESEQLRMLILLTPAGLEGWFFYLGKRQDDRSPSLEFGRHGRLCELSA